MAEKPNILIAVPCYRQIIDARTSVFVESVAVSVAKLGWSFTSVRTDMADITTTRNFYGSVMIERPEFSHLLFIDNDMIARAEAVIRLVQSRKQIIGLACPRRHLDIDRMISELSKGASKDTAMARAMSWAFTPEPGVKPIGGLLAVRRVGTGITLISREVFDKLAENAPRTPQPKIQGLGDTGGFKLTGDLFGFFDAVDGLSEDNSFCERWKRADGEVFIVIDEPVGHVGQFVYQARLSDVLQKNDAQGVTNSP